MTSKKKKNYTPCDPPASIDSNFRLQFSICYNWFYGSNSFLWCMPMNFCRLEINVCTPIRLRNFSKLIIQKRMIQLFEVTIVITTKRKKRELLHDKRGELCNYNKKKRGSNCHPIWVIFQRDPLSLSICYKYDKNKKSII